MVMINIGMMIMMMKMVMLKMTMMKMVFVERLKQQQRWLDKASDALFVNRGTAMLSRRDDNAFV